ncbi:MAG: hypothetical protein J6W64_11335 [Bacilli bacterium]|nr:hypothetical protein [Bacilli bacterium]
MLPLTKIIPIYYNAAICSFVRPTIRAEYIDQLVAALKFDTNDSLTKILPRIPPVDTV